MKIKIEYSEDGLFGGWVDETDGYDIPASVRQFGESLENHVRDEYPNTEIEIVAGSHDRVTVDGDEDHDEAPAVGAIVDRVYNGDSWAIGKGE